LGFRVSSVGDILGSRVWGLGFRVLVIYQHTHEYICIYLYCDISIFISVSDVGVWPGPSVVTYELYTVTLHSNV
jgi:hypothetical protein